MIQKKNAGKALDSILLGEISNQKNFLREFIDQKIDDEEGKVTTKKILEMPLMKVIQLKKLIDQIYGEGIFSNLVGE